ncbi:extracellular solute-binding protein [Allorhizobium sp. BGMRC 0089]|uniref:extracellular solute-binding protein n=1 Tax=Allorhizobium sonneratiae TaxID=2934936 RepID=UPI00203336C4|nr:extracellular solute-binding protein [Allorhizobium sonneratiae]MCM2293910.1 extracellular solute-binding protein [Allorhizobium sonneratiae]
MLRKLLVTAVTGLFLTGPAFAADLVTMPWSKVVDQARAEGELTWYVWYHQPEFRKEVKAFETQYGIRVNLPSLSNANDALNKVMAENGRMTGDIDVIAMGGQSGSQLDMAKLFYGPILPLMPEAKNLTDQAEGTDWKGYGIKFWGNQTGLAYDSNRVKQADLPQSLDDLSKWMAANPQQLGFNYENGGSGPSFIENVARNVLGLKPDDKVTKVPDLKPVYDWFNTRKDQYVITASNNDSLVRLNSGEFLLVPSWEDLLTTLQRNHEIGDNIKFYIPKFGMNGGGNVVAIPANAPHKAAALLFISWLTSAKTQTTFNQDFGSAPANTAADSSKALVPAAERVNSRNWNAPLSDHDITPGFIANVVQK